MNRLVTGILAHVDAGKTTLSEAILYKSDIIRTPGRVDSKDAFLDNYILERERGITIFSKQAVFERGGVSFTLVDTPGHVDFSTEMERALSVLDVAILVISGPEGIQAHTRTLWKLLKTYDIPSFIFVNKMDRGEADRAQIAAMLEEQLSPECIDFGSGILSDELKERIALCDEDIMEKYLESGELSDEDIRYLIGERKLFPCFYGSALKIDGIDEFLDSFARFAPRYEAESEFGARVYKITRDEAGNRLTHLKLTGGRLKNREVVTYYAKPEEKVSAGEDEGDSEPVLMNEKITGIRVYNGEKYESIDEAYAGQLVEVMGLSSTYPGQVMGAEEEVYAPEIVPVMTYKVVTNDKSHLLQLLPKLRILEEEDPSLNIMWNPEVRELQIQIMGEIQLEILKRQLHDRFMEDVDFDKGSVLYKETVSSASLGVGHFEPLRHYAEAQLLIEPGEPGSGINIESRVSTNDLELNWQRLILTHILEREHKGVLTGAFLTDVKISLVAGRAHLKHTEGGDFRQATYRAIRQGLMRARQNGDSVLLEPYYELTLELPRTFVGRAMTDVEKNCGRITSQYEVGAADMVGLTAVAPVSTMQGYAKEVSSYTKGLGSLYLSFYGYLPCHNTDEVVAKTGYVPEADLRNPASSVFCAHGAGFVVEWQDVDSYKHLDWDEKTGKLRGETVSDQTGAINFVSHASEGAFVGYEEVDAIIARTAYSNKRETKHRNPYRKQHTERTAVNRSGSNALTSGSNTAQPSAKSRQAQKEQYLLVDGYNIIFAWKELNELAAANVDGARERLNEILCDYQAASGCNLIVVYDAYRVAGHPTEYFKHHNIGVVYTKEAETADRFIERFAHENAKQYDITVATSDGLEQIIIRGAGCRLMTASDLFEGVKRSRSENIERYIDGPKASVGTRLGDILK